MQLTVQEQFDLFNKSKGILKTLPLGYYMRTKTINTSLKSTSTSYFSPRDFEIVVAFNNIKDFIENSFATMPNDEELETIIRNLLYHEVSHALLTPKDLMVYGDYYKVKDLFNIIEDERIETIFKNYYLKVNFKQNIKSICQLDKNNSYISFMGFVFNALRLDYSPIKIKEIKKLFDDFVIKNSNVNFATEIGAKLDELANNFIKLINDLKAIYDELVASAPKTPQPQPQQNNNSQQNGNSQSETESSNQETEDDEQNGENDSAGSSENQESVGTEDEQETETESAEDGKTETENVQTEMESNTGFTCEKVEEIVKSAVDEMKEESTKFDGGSLKTKFFDQNTRNEIINIIDKKIGFGAKQGQAQYGYSGKFNTKAYMKDKNDTCKWFAKKAFEDNGVKANKTNEKVLNIWLDNSGSYYCNDAETNKILSALADIEKCRKDFKFNLVKITMWARQLHGDDRISVSDGGNAMNFNEYNRIYKEINPNKSEFNIVLFDGRCYFDDSEAEAFKVFNNDRCILISESSNENKIRKHCSKARKIIIENRNYTEKLKDNIIDALKILF